MGVGGSGAVVPESMGFGHYEASKWKLGCGLI